MTTESKSVLDKLENRKRDALVATCRGPLYIINGQAGTPLLTVDDLYSHFLIDTQVSSDVIGTNIVEVIASLQQYINNIVFCIEPGYDSIEWLAQDEPEEDEDEGDEEDDPGDTEPPDEINSRTIQRKKNHWIKIDSEYSTWRADALIAEYPSNYLSPSLRFNQTEAFKSLSNVLSRGNLDDVTTASAVEKYLSDFEKVSNLIIVSAYLGSVNNTYTGMLYILGRTPDASSKFFYRTVDLNAVDTEGYPVANAWTGWQEISTMTTSGQHIGRPRICLQNDRVYVIWYERMANPDDSTLVGGDVANNDDAYIQITGSSVYQKIDGTWSSPNTIATYKSAPPVLDPIPPYSYPLYVPGVQDENYYSTVAFEYKPLNGNPFIFSAIYTYSVGELLQPGGQGFAKELVLAGYVDALMNPSVEPEPHLFVETLETYGNTSTSTKPQNRVQVLLQGSEVDTVSGSKSIVMINTSEVTEPEPTIFVDKGLPVVEAQTKENAAESNVLSVTKSSNTYSVDFQPRLTSEQEFGDVNYTFAAYDPSSGALVVSGDYSIDTATWTAILTVNITPGQPLSVKTMKGLSADKLPYLWFLKKGFVQGGDVGKGMFLTSTEATGVIYQTDNSFQIYMVATNGGKLGSTHDTPDTTPNNFDFSQVLIEFPSLHAGLNGKHDLDVLISVPAWNHVAYGVQPGQNFMSYTNVAATTVYVPKVVTYKLVASKDMSSFDSQSPPLTGLTQNSKYLLTGPASSHVVDLYLGVIRLIDDKPSGQHWRRAFFKEVTPYVVDADTLPLVKTVLDANDANAFAAVCLDATQLKYPRGAGNKYPLIRLNTTFAAALVRQANLGLDYLFNWATQLTTEPSMIEDGEPNPIDFRGANAIYYWELFLHVPQLVAEMYCAQGDYLSALTWYHRIFDPRARNQKSPSVQEIPDYWNVVPIAPLDDDAPTPILAPYYSGVNGYPNDPYAAAYNDPYYFRQGVYMGYIGALIGAGDIYYRRLTFDSVNKAMQLYTHAGDLLGDRPVTDLSSFSSNLKLKDVPQTASSQAHADVALPLNWPIYPMSDYQVVKAAQDPTTTFYPPQNERLMGLWDTIDARRFNIRHNLDISGRKIKFPLYLGYFDNGPGSRRLTKSGSTDEAGTGPDLIVPPYRYEVMVGMARNAVSTVIGFGQQLIGYMGGVDSRGAQELQQSQLIELQAYATRAAEFSVELANKTLSVLQVSLESAKKREDYFSGLISNGLLSHEKDAFIMSTSSQVSSQVAGQMFLVGYGINGAPNIFGASNGGSRLGNTLIGLGADVSVLAHGLAAAAGDTAQVAANERRLQGWKFQLGQASEDVVSANLQIEAQKIQIDAAKNSRNMTLVQTRQINEMMEFITKKTYTNKDLYVFLMSSMTNFYNLAFDQALALCYFAQACWQYEQVDNQDFFANTNPWDSDHYGLLAGETLLLALNSMDAVWHIAKNTRKFEITKTISLREHVTDTDWDDMKDTTNKEKYGCLHFTLEESIFNDDYPNQYLRQIVSVSVTLPAAIGPMQNVCALLTLESSTMNVPSGKTISRATPVQVTALSNGVNDAGLFVLNFGDPRYLPFEGAGAASVWTLKFSNVANNTAQAAILSSLDDVIFTMHYTARIDPTKITND